ncbi:Dihydrofolate reductase [Lachnellula subtilissima]|uniref:Dihydrofolate reductase n=1 Tax=Lachnellula subtilissima TaxID=602034 RepID=A0A8H8UEV2_9HELO|nr:Dihydrofolate reductase [Lachnellula subtilissima]
MTTTADNDPAMPLPELTLIVAATSKMGIGLRGTLPWTGLKKEMAYFARVTKRAPSPGAKNTVIMGRKTWDSIPPRFRPLKERQNVVISRSLERTSSTESQTVGSLPEALALLSQQSTASESGSKTGKAFIIGGAQIYEAALELKQARRILLTRILSDFECDTFFPVELPESGEKSGWRRRGQEVLDAWVGESVSGEVQEEAGTKYIFEMWERDD